MLDKKAIRKFLASNPAPTIPPNHGLLHVRQIAYIIRAAVRNIASRRTLILRAYNREQAEASVQAPVWTVFHAGGDYATLERDAGGKPVDEMYGGDVPDEVVYDWALDFIRDESAGTEPEDKFVPKPYVPARKPSKAPKAKTKTPAEAKAPAKKEPASGSAAKPVTQATAMEQLSLI